MSSEGSPYIVDENEPSNPSTLSVSWLKSRTGKVVAMTTSAVVLFGLTAVASFAGSNLPRSNHSTSQIKPGDGLGSSNGTEVPPSGSAPKKVAPKFGNDQLGPKRGDKFGDHDGPSIGNRRDDNEGRDPGFEPNFSPTFSPSR